MAGLTSVKAAMMTIGDTLGLQLGPIKAGFLLCCVDHARIIYMVFIGCLIQFIVPIVIEVIVLLLRKKLELPPASSTG